MKQSITVKLVLAFLVVSVTGLALASGLTYWLTVSRFKQLVLSQARDQFVTEAAFYYQMNGSWTGVLDYFQRRNAIPQQGFPGSQPNPQPFPGPGTGQPQNRNFDFLLADTEGRVLIPAGTYQVGEILPTAKLAQGTAIQANGQLVGTVVVAGSAPTLGTLETSYLNRTNLALIYAAIGAALVALVLGIILARTLTHPLREMTAAIRLMAKGNLKQHVRVNSHDEIGELAFSFNQMSTDLERANESRKQMTADIAHDLRSPLTVIGGYLESMRDGVLKPTPQRIETVYSEVQHLQRLVEDLRTLSLTDTGALVLTRQPVAPLKLLENLSAAYSHLAGKQEISLKVQAETGLPEISIDPDRLIQVMGNLINNALQHTPKSGEIVLGAKAKDKNVVLSVQDNGSGIAPAALTRVFERFYRNDDSRQDGSSGLGLAIAKAIVELHGGHMEAYSAGEGTGSTFSVFLPVK